MRKEGALFLKRLAVRGIESKAVAQSDARERESRVCSERGARETQSGKRSAMRGRRDGAACEKSVFEGATRWRARAVSAETATHGAARQMKDASSGVY